MEKIATDKVAAIVGQVGPTLRALAAENGELKEKVAFYEKRDRVTKLASEMESKQLDTDTSYNDKVERLMRADNLDVVEEAVRMSAPQIKLASVSDHPGNPSNALSALEAAILGDD